MRANEGGEGKRVKGVRKEIKGRRKERGEGGSSGGHTT